MASAGARILKCKHHEQGTSTTVEVSPGEYRTISGGEDPLACENDDSDDGVDGECLLVTSPRPSRAGGAKAASAAPTSVEASNNASEGRGIRDPNRKNEHEDEENRMAGVNPLACRSILTLAHLLLVLQSWKICRMA